MIMSSRQNSCTKPASPFFLKPLDKASFVEDCSSDYSIHATSRVESSSAHPHTPSSFASARKASMSDFIFLNRKKTMDFLMTDNLIRHNQIYGNNPVPTGGLKLSGFDSPSSATKYKYPGLVSPVNSNTKKKAFEKEVSFPSLDKKLSNLSDSIPKEVFQELLDAGKKVPKFISPMSPKSLITHKASTSRDKTTQIIQNHNHRIYGMDHLNLKKLNTMLKTKVETPKSSSAGLSPFSGNQLYSAKAAEMRAEEENILKDYNAYEYNPLSDGFQFSGPDMSELGSLLASLTAPSKQATSPTSKGPFNSKRRVIMKSQTLHPDKELLSPPKLIGSHSTDFKNPESSPQGNVAKPSSFTKKRRGSIGDISETGEGLRPFGMHPERFSQAMKLKEKVPEESLEEQSQRIIAHTYRCHEPTKPMIKFTSVKDNMKRIHNLCGELEVQNKKIMSKFKQNKKQLGQNYNNLNKRVSSFMESPIAETLLSNNP